ncbi:MAG TPA: hypothetical protein VFZ00_27235 [Solirubrobacter sp.]|nr:hypothetical protein [Solirubrobacter sp.]
METNFLIPLLLLCISAGIGVLIRQASRQSEKTEEVRVTLSRVEATVTSTVSRVDDLHRWRSQVQEREAADLRQTIAELRRERSLEEAS